MVDLSGEDYAESEDGPAWSDLGKETLLATGGFATTYHVVFRGNDAAGRLLLPVHEHTDRFYEQGTAAKLLESIDDEVKKLSKLEHDNIIAFRGVVLRNLGEFYVPLWILTELAKFTVVDLRDEAGRPEMLEGDSLRQLMSVARQIASGLEFLHQESCKQHLLIPSHAKVIGEPPLWESDIKVKLMPSDLEISRLCSEVTAEENQHEMLELMQKYAAPEAQEMIRRKASKRSDIYAFGVILVSLLTGQEPADDHGTREQQAGEAAGRYQDLADIIVRCTDGQSHMRPTAKQVLDNLYQILVCVFSPPRRVRCPCDAVLPPLMHFYLSLASRRWIRQIRMLGPQRCRSPRQSQTTTRRAKARTTTCRSSRIRPR